MTMPLSASPVELAYRNRIDAMAPYERVARSAALFQWTREQIARQIMAEQDGMDDDRLKWLVALRLYGNSPIVRGWIERKLANVSG